MRNITDHRVNGLNEAIRVTAAGAPGPGGANTHYKLSLVTESIQHGFDSVPSKAIELEVVFQNGPIQSPADMNGFSNESFVAMVIDRMRGFQYGRKADGSFDEAMRGKFACRENAVALTHLEEALMWLQKRTRDRMARGVEGTLKA